MVIGVYWSILERHSCFRRVQNFENFEKQLLASTSLSVRPHGSSRLPLDGFSLNLVFEYFRTSFEKIQVSLKFDKNNAYFT